MKASVLILKVASTSCIMAVARAKAGVPRSCEGSVYHIHLAVGHDPAREMTISFASTWSNNESVAPIGGVRLGLAPDQLDRFVPEQEYPLQYNTTIHHEHHPTQEYVSPFQHHITLGGLKPSTKYHYVAVVGDREAGIEKLAATSFGDSHSRSSMEEREAMMHGENNNDEDGTLRLRRRLSPPAYDGSDKPCTDGHKVRSFTTAPESSESPVSFAIVGDLGQFGHSQEILDHMRKTRNKVDAVMLVGDIAYANGYHDQWDTFFDFLDDFSIFDEVPLQVATGNHDIEKQENGTSIFQAYETRFRMPQVRPAELGVFDFPGKLNLDAPPYPLPYDWGNAYYSFVYGPAKHIVVSAYSAMEPDSAQYTWLKRELESVDRTVTPWLLVSIHTPLYSTYAVHKHDPQIFAAQEHMEPIFVKHHVNVVFTGHIHAYQRTANVAMGKRDPKGPMHVTVGAGGRQCDAPFENEETEEWLVKRDASFYGYGRFSILNQTHAEWKWIPVSAVDKPDYNYVKGHEETHLGRLKRDKVVLENQFFLD